MRYLLLKIYPLIHTLFNNPRFNPKLKFQNIWISSQKSIPESSSLVKKKTRSSPLTWPLKNRFSFIVKRRNTPPQILFASVTPMFSDIIYKAAQICNMPWHKNRWLSGSITAAISYPSDKLIWQYLQDATQKEIVHATSTQWGNNKENEEKIKEKIKHYSHSRWPSLLIIPDISNNNMILKEAKKVGLPVIGLINSNCSVEIDYPIFAQDQTPQSVHFFCHFLAILIAKETVFLQHKRYTLQKVLHKINEFSQTQNNMVSKFKKQPFFKQKKIFTLNKGFRLQKIKATWKKPFFFNVVKHWQQKFSRRYFLSLNLQKYHPLFSKTKPYRKNHWKNHYKKKKI